MGKSIKCLVCGKPIFISNYDEDKDRVLCEKCREDICDNAINEYK